MKKIVFLLLCVPTLVLAQKVKIKKDDVFVDKVHVGTVVKTKDSISKLFTYKDLEGTTLATYAAKFVPSPIEGMDDGYYYSEITFPEYNIAQGISFEKGLISFPLQTRKSFVKSLAKKGYIDGNGKIIAVKVKTDFPGPAVPELITAYLEVEAEQQQHLDYIIERDFNEPVVLVKGASEQKNKQYLKSVGFSSFFFEDYKIKQGDKVIGKIKLRYNAALGNTESGGLQRGKDPKIYFFNMKGGRVAWSHGILHDLKIHNGGIRLKSITTKFLKEDNLYTRLKSISKYLVQEGKL